jgi:hypothetical protein
MHKLAPRLSPTLLASALLVAAASLLAACGPIVSSANAQGQAPSALVSGSVAFGGVTYFGDEYATIEKTLVADNKSPTPTF